MSNAYGKPRRIKAEVIIDPTAWAKVYGLDPKDLVAIQEDASAWAHNLLTQAAEMSGVLAGESSNWARD